MRIKIDGEIYEVKEVYNGSHYYLPEIETYEGPSFVLARDSTHAGKKAREYWEDMAQNDPSEFACMVGEETLVKWALKQWAGPGTTQVRSLDEWFDLWLDIPEEQWASYDNDERTVDRVGKLVEELGFTPTVAYRHN